MKRSQADRTSLDTCSERDRSRDRDTVLERIRAAQPVSRLDLSYLTNLRAKTVSSVVDHLIAEGWVKETEATSSTRHQRLLSLNEKVAFLVADVGSRRIAVAAMDMQGTILSLAHVPIEESPESTMQAVRGSMKEFLHQSPDYRFRGIGVTLPTSADAKTNQLRWRPDLTGESFDIAEYLESAFGMRVEVENATKASLLSELWFTQHSKYSRTVLLSISDVVETAVLEDGQIVSSGPSRLLVRPGMDASTRGLICLYRELADTQEQISTQDMLRLIALDDELAVAAMKIQARAIGDHLRTLNDALSPDVVLLAGDISSYWRAARPLIEEAAGPWREKSLKARIACVGDGELGRLRGAVSVLLRRFPSTLGTQETAKIELILGDREQRSRKEVGSGHPRSLQSWAERTFQVSHEMQLVPAC